MEITEKDIEYTLKLKSKDEKNRIKIVFVDEDKRDSVISQRKKLKGKEIWLTDDLTPYRSRIAYLARNAVKNEHAHQTWTTDGKIFIKKGQNSAPKRIMTEDELLEYLEL